MLQVAPRSPAIMHVGQIVRDHGRRRVRIPVIVNTVPIDREQSERSDAKAVVVFLIETEVDSQIIPAGAEGPISN